MLKYFFTSWVVITILLAAAIIVQVTLLFRGIRIQVWKNKS